MNIKNFKVRCSVWRYKSWAKGNLEEYWSRGGLTVEQIFRNREVLSGRTYPIAILGSVGKTSLLQVLQLLIRQAGYSCYTTRVNDNWLPQLPFAVHLACREGADYSLFECGVAARGDTELMAAIVPARAVIYTQFADVNIAALGSRQGVADEKLSLGRRYPEAALISHVANKPFLQQPQNITFYGEKPSDVQFQYSIKQMTEEETVVEVNHLKTSSLVYIGDMGYHLGAAGAGALAAFSRIRGEDPPEIVRLDTYKNPQQRMQSYFHKGVYVIIDTANANEPSILNALKTLLKVKSERPKHAVVGEIAGLGSATTSIMGYLMESMYKLDLCQLASLHLVGTYFTEHRDEIERRINTCVVFYRNSEDLQKHFSIEEFRDHIVLLRSATQQGKNFSNLLGGYNSSSDETSPEDMAANF